MPFPFPSLPLPPRFAPPKERAYFKVVYSQTPGVPGQDISIQWYPTPPGLKVHNRDWPRWKLPLSGKEKKSIMMERVVVDLDNVDRSRFVGKGVK